MAVVRGVVVAVVVTVGVVLAVVVATGVTTATLQVGMLIVLLSRVTAPFLASTRPVTEAPVLRVIEVKANTLPDRLELVPKVADEPTCQKILQACAPLMRFTLLAEAVVRVEPMRKIKTASGLPCPSRTKVPVRAREEAEV